MRIIIISETPQAEEFRSRFSAHEVLDFRSHHEAHQHFNQARVIFDFIIDEDPSQLQYYSNCTIPIFLNSVKSTLKELLGVQMKGVRFFGFNGLLTFINRHLLEVSIINKEDKGLLTSICSELGTRYELAPDQPGMVTARVVFMIINEGFSAIEDGTASAEDIDLAMKLGTNYPRGPIEWGRQIGLKNVCDVLDALYHQTGNSRYTVCNLLREESRRE